MQGCKDSQCQLSMQQAYAEGAGAVGTEVKGRTLASLFKTCSSRPPAGVY